LCIEYKKEEQIIEYLESQNLHEALDHVTKALVNINKAIFEFKEQEDSERVNELEILKASLEMSQKVILYGLFHN